MEFVIQQLELDSQLEYAALKAAATKKNLVVYPIMYGRAKALLGLVPTAPRGTGKRGKAKAKAKAAKAKVAKVAKAPSTPRAKSKLRLSSGNPLDSLEAMLAEMKDVAVQRDRYRDALERIAEVLDDALR